MDVLTKVKKSISDLPFILKIFEFEEGSTKTSEMAAEQLGVEAAQIAKSMLFICGDKPILVVTCGDMKVKQGRLKRIAGVKPRFASYDECKKITGYEPGGMCPFALKKEIEVLLDKSIERFDKVYAAAGTANTAVPLDIEQLSYITKGKIVEVCEPKMGQVNE
jgi:prolyl-tRNA editing enzyme YbaK/EbsC (Cys-tRNA(Pro) deacylase)